MSTNDENTTAYQPGDVANGHILTHDRGWVPLVFGMQVNGHVLTADRGWVRLDVVKARNPLYALLLVGSAIGLIMALQSASLLTGTGLQWTGFALTAGACVAAIVLKPQAWVTWVASGCAALALVSVVYLEVQMEEKRQEIGQIFNGS